MIKSFSLIYMILLQCINLSLIYKWIINHETYQETIMAMSTRDPAHSRNVWNWVNRWSCWGQTYHSFTIRSRTSNPLACVFTNQQTIARTSNIFASWRSVFDRCCFIAGGAFYYMLFTFSCNVDHSLEWKTFSYHKFSVPYEIIKRCHKIIIS